jgi:hypothetical protein
MSDDKARETLSKMSPAALAKLKEQFRRVEESVRRQRPKVLKRQEEKLSKLAPEFKNEIRQMATRRTWEELLELQKQMETQAEQLELRAWFVGYVAMEKLRAVLPAPKEDAA